MTETDKAKEIIRKEQEKAAMELLSGMVALQDTLCLRVEECGEINGGEEDSIVYANNSLISFEDSNPNFKNANPRSIREDDRKKILPGQHAGVFLQFDLQDGTILRINFWGGLRTVSTMDYRDSDTSLRVSHTARTDEIAEQRTQLNWQLYYPNGPTIDSWIVYNPNDNGSFRQGILKIDGESVDCHPCISVKDSQFEQIKKGVFNPIEKLIKLVPSSF